MVLYLFSKLEVLLILSIVMDLILIYCINLLEVKINLVCETCEGNCLWQGLQDHSLPLFDEISNSLDFGRVIYFARCQGLSKDSWH